MTLAGQQHRGRCARASCANNNHVVRRVHVSSSASSVL